MICYAQSVGGYYLAPYYGSFGGSQYEPAGQTTPTDGSNLPDYVTFCMDCHINAQYDGERFVAVKAIEWGPPWSSSLAADTHGAHAGGGYWHGVTKEQGNLRAPYNDTNKENGYNYVLSCTDCHGPMGALRGCI